MFDVWRTASAPSLLRAACCRRNPRQSSKHSLFPIWPITYLNIQIIACVKAYHNPGIVICRQRNPQRAADLPQHWACCASPKQPPASSTHQKICSSQEVRQGCSEENPYKKWKCMTLIQTSTKSCCRSWHISRRNLWKQENKNQEIVFPSLFISILLKSSNFYHDNN